jgi:hypothetical protein
MLLAFLASFLAIFAPILPAGLATFAPRGLLGLLLQAFLAFAELLGLALQAVLAPVAPLLLAGGLPGGSTFPSLLPAFLPLLTASEKAYFLSVFAAQAIQAGGSLEFHRFLPLGRA